MKHSIFIIRLIIFTFLCLGLEIYLRFRIFGEIINGTELNKHLFGAFTTALLISVISQTSHFKKIVDLSNQTF